MKYKIEIWSVKQLLDLVDEGNIDLNPPYQRNPIWTKQTQKYLIESMKSGSPIPNIFLFETSPNKYEIVDGQQRTRALKAFRSSEDIKLTDNDTEYKNGLFAEYQIPVTIITEVGEGEHIEEFYYMVNSSGIKLNRPETYKAHYFNKNFLKLVEKINTSQQFQELNIVPLNSQKRMMDRELVEELCALVLHGITDKKNQVDKIYQSDITIEESQNCELKFNEILKHFKRFNEIKLLKETRYRQRNDFYTLFGFIKDNLNISEATWDYFYKILIAIEVGIRPIKEACPPLSDYAFNCVSQSNSAKARQARVDILNGLFLNDTEAPTPTQNEIINFYSVPNTSMIKLDNYLVFEENTLKTAVSLFHSQD